MNRVKFSIVIPVYNKEKHIINTIQSVIDQEFVDYEIVIVDDGSTDKSITYLKSLNNCKINIYHQNNSGVSSARNRGIKQSKGEFILFLDADDIWKNNHIKIINSLIDEFPLNSVFSSGFAIKNNDRVTKIQKVDAGIVDNYFKQAIIAPVVHTSSICIRKNVFNDLDAFNEQITHGEDIELWARLARNYQIVLAKEVSAYYLKGLDNQATKSMSKLEKSIVNYVDFSHIHDSYEKKYFQKIIISRFFSYLKRGYYKNLIVIFRKYSNEIGVFSYLRYAFVKLIFKNIYKFKGLK